jgi:L-fuculose-phosphate aldolase
MEGNVSIKLNKKYFLIKASGSKLNNIKKNEIILCGFDGKQKNNFNKKPSMEYGFHSYLLGFDEVNCVSHTHPPNVMKILCTKNSKKFSDTRLFPDQVIFNGVKSCLIPYGKPGEDLNNLIKLHLSKFLKKEKYFPKVILLQNHGIITCGKNVSECIMSNDICEKSAEIFNGSFITGKLTTLNKKEIDSLITDKLELYRKNLL